MPSLIDAPPTTCAAIAASLTLLTAGSTCGDVARAGRKCEEHFYVDSTGLYGVCKYQALRRTCTESNDNDLVACDPPSSPPPPLPPTAPPSPPAFPLPHPPPSPPPACHMIAGSLRELEFGKSCEDVSPVGLCEQHFFIDASTGHFAVCALEQGLVRRKCIEPLLENRIVCSPPSPPCPPSAPNSSPAPPHRIQKILKKAVIAGVVATVAKTVSTALSSAPPPPWAHPSSAPAAPPVPS